MGRPVGSKNKSRVESSTITEPMEESMAEVKTNIAPPQDEVIKSKGNCPWCEFEGEAPDGSEKKKVKSDYSVRNVGLGYHQCDFCGKTWEKAALGKPYSIELERGAAWTRENRIKELGGRA